MPTFEFEGVKMWRRVVLQAFKDLASEDDMIRTDATEWFVCENFPEVIKNADMDLGSIAAVYRKLLKMSDLTQRRVIVDEVVDLFKKIEGSQY